MRTLVTGDQPDVSRLGIALTAVSLVLMPYFGMAKRRVGKQLGSRATEGEGMQNFLCAYLSAAVLVGLTANALFGWWWADPLAALDRRRCGARRARELARRRVLLVAGVGLHHGVERTVQVCPPSRDCLIVPSCSAT